LACVKGNRQVVARRVIKEDIVMKRMTGMALALSCVFLGLLIAVPAGAGSKKEVANPFARYQKNILKIKEKIGKLKPGDQAGHDKYEKKLKKERESLQKAAEHARAPIERAIEKLENKMDKLDAAGKAISKLEKEVEVLNEKLDQIDKWEDEAMQEEPKEDAKKGKKKKK